MVFILLFLFNIISIDMKVNWDKVWSALGLIGTILVAIVSIIQGRKP
jgi:hypothetical protein